jgi:hypothetical protein
VEVYKTCAIPIPDAAGSQMRAPHGATHGVGTGIWAANQCIVAVAGSWKSKRQQRKRQSPRAHNPSIVCTTWEGEAKAH